jgi:uncharacterized protein YjbI with pentapeptide repeats
MVDGPPQPADDGNTNAQQRSRRDWWRAGAWPLAFGLLGVILLGLLLACVLWIPGWLYPAMTEADLESVSDAARVQELRGARLKLQNDARTTLLQGLGAVLVLTGAAIGAVMTLRQIRVSHDQLRVTRDQMLHTLETTQQQLHLTEQGQITDRYNRAVEQLGHEKAPVRLGALYSLERLAQDNPEYRQTVIDVFCAYLRMPYTPASRSQPSVEQVGEAAPAADDRERALQPVPGQDSAAGELQVRQTAQRILAGHLKLPEGPFSVAQAQREQPSPAWIFWPGITLDLTGAILVDFNFAQVSVIQARFDEATFQGDAEFGGVTSQGNASFHRATFQGDAEFYKAIFQGAAVFGGATVEGNARFGGAAFQGNAVFGGATFEGDAYFGGVDFQGTGNFGGAAFQGTANFDRATFQDHAAFPKATFQGAAEFRGVTFHGAAEFLQATFEGNAGFDDTTFQGTNFFVASFSGNARFDKATFYRKAGFDKATFEGAASFGGVTFEDKAEFGEAAFQGNAYFGGATFQGDAYFGGVTFQGTAGFDKATFQGNPWFLRATFQGDAGFGGATFEGDVGFDSVDFQGAARFDEATFQGHADFGGAAFEGAVRFDTATFTGGNGLEGVVGAHVLRLDDPDLNKYREWPDGCTVRPDPDDRARGTLVRVEQATASELRPNWEAGGTPT